MKPQTSLQGRKPDFPGYLTGPPRLLARKMSNSQENFIEHVFAGWRRVAESDRIKKLAVIRGMQIISENNEYLQDILARCCGGSHGIITNLGFEKTWTWIEPFSAGEPVLAI